MKKIRGIILFVAAVIILFVFVKPKELDFSGTGETIETLIDTVQSQNGIEQLIDAVQKEESSPSQTLAEDTDTKLPETDTEFSLGNLDGPYLVKKVIDGDTVVLQIDKLADIDLKVRLIGVDTPESVAPQTYLDKTGKENSKEGLDASTFTKNLLLGQYVYVEYDAGTEDKYGRALAYLYMEDGTMVNEHLLLEGVAQLMTVQPNVKYVDRFVEAEKKARKNNKGFWDTEVFQ